MKSVTVTVGWTKSKMPEYSSFGDGYKPGAEQHTEVLTFEVPEDYDNEQVAWTLLTATNAPFVSGPAAAALEALQATGYRGFGAHYSLSTGDTVTFEDGTSLAFTGYAVEPVTVVAA